MAVSTQISATPLTSPSEASWLFDFAFTASTLRLGLTLAEPPAERGVIVTLAASAGRETVPATAGLTWSEKMSAQYAYFPGPGRTVWFSPEITFAGPVDRVQVSIFRWPAAEQLARREVRRLFLRVPEGPLADEGSELSALYLASMEDTR